ncbi:uncharacterized protein LOC114529767 [Dendronephthya gigantea]|uniref:uncharacterized protein LOC114529767 n=1 Tax=Dendronephthya gigantea TaxID=151771 RepID=UPI0010692D2A|nr:uncharacterized protein LOC114529767 [Dendronephthya gigantea]
MAFAFHMEALRKQRLLDRKNDALDRISLRQTEIERLNEETLRQQRRRTLEQDEANSQAREYYIKNMGRMGTLNQNGHPQRYIDMIPERQHGVNRDDLRHQARVLRDSCLYMGPVNEYFWS